MTHLSGVEFLGELTVKGYQSRATTTLSMTLRCGRRIIRRCIERPYAVGMAEAAVIGQYDQLVSGRVAFRHEGIYRSACEYSDVRQ